MRDIRLIWASVRTKWDYMVAYGISTLLSVIFSLISLAMLVPFLNLLFGRQELVLKNPGFYFSSEGIQKFFLYHLSRFIVEHGHDKVWGLAFIIVIVLAANLLKNLFLFLSKYLLSPLRQSIIRNIRNDLFSKILHLPIGFFSEERKGDILSRMSNDVSEVEQSIVSVMELMFSVPLTVLVYLMVMFAISVKLCLFLIILLPLAGWLIGRVSKKLKKQSSVSQERLGVLTSIIDETLGGLRIIKAFKAEDQRDRIFRKESEDIYHLANSIAGRRELASPLSEFLGVCVLGVILWFGGKMVLGKTPEIDGGTFIMFILIFTQLLDPLKKLSQIFYNLARGKAAFERINKILHAENGIRDMPGAVEIKHFEKQIEFKNVSFAYQDKKVLTGINLLIPKGKMIALVGASGSGKSTLVDLIPRFHDVLSGEILLDGKNIKEYKLADLRSLIGVVSQEPVLFNDSISNNVALGEDPMNLDKVKESCRVAHAQDFILEKEKQYDSNIGDRGGKLSGGEKQRLTIARAMYKNPPILILDEATSSLDTVSEKMVQMAIENVMKNRTSIVIAHRLSTVQHADEIIVMDSGRVVEQGTHEELLNMKGSYYNLVEMQQLDR